MKSSTQNLLVFCGIVVLILAGITFSLRSQFVSSSMTITSSAFDDNGDIPSKYTCDGANISPPLTISNLPKKTRSVVVSVYDQDVPRGGFVHWVVYNVDSRTTNFEEGEVPMDSAIGLNSANHDAYDGPCPPAGKKHRYLFTAYAVSNVYKFVNPPDLAKLKKVMRWQVLGSAQMTGKYAKATSAE